MSKTIESIITICIPAYNNEEYTRKTLRSVLDQTFRPIKIVLIDDASPNSLQKLADEFVQEKDNKVEFIFLRNKQNLAANNLIRCYENVHTDWMIMLHHDDWFIDKFFIEECVSLIKNADDDLNIIYSNAITEKTKIRMVNNTDESWKLLTGPEFLLYILKNGHAAWSSICYKYSELKKFNYPRPPFLIDNDCKAKTNLDQDEGFSGFYLLCQTGNAVVSGKITAIRGEPSTSYSRNSNWKTVGPSLFFIYMGIYLEGFKYKYSKKVNQICWLSTYLYGLDSLMYLGTMLRYFNQSIVSYLTFQYLVTYFISKLKLNHFALEIGLKSELKNTFLANTDILLKCLSKYFERQK
jgi:glycosyltransferase involved in cell wall biosynthesis